MTQNSTEDQHFVPVCYLKKFSKEHGRNPKVYVYDKLGKSVRHIGVKSVCYCIRLYSINKESEFLISDDIIDKETIFESHYLHDFEQEYSEELNRIINLIKAKTFSAEDKAYLSWFMALQILRHPVIKEVCNTPEFQKILPPSPQNEYFSKVYDSTLSNDSALMHFVLSYGDPHKLRKLALSLAELEWTFIYTEEDGFFTSDYPVFMVPDELEIYRERIKMGSYGDSYLLFPISKNILLSIKPFYQKGKVLLISNLSKEQRDRFNLIISVFAYKYVISSTEFDDGIKKILDETPNVWDINKINIYGKTSNANH